MILTSAQAAILCRRIWLHSKQVECSECNATASNGYGCCLQGWPHLAHGRNVGHRHAPNPVRGAHLFTEAWQAITYTILHWMLTVLSFNLFLCQCICCTLLSLILDVWMLDWNKQANWMNACLLSWSKSAPLRIPRAFASAAVIRDCVWICGGCRIARNDDKYPTSMTSVDVSAHNSEWRKACKLVVARHSTSVTAIGESKRSWSVTIRICCRKSTRKHSFFLFLKQFQAHYKN